MSTNDIQRLLDRYFDGETSLTEEQRLRDYFNGPDVAPEVAHFQSLFQFYTAEQEIRTSEGFDERLLARLQETAPPVAKVRRLSFSLRKVAAMLLIGGASLWTIQQCQDWAPAATTPAPSGPVASTGIDWSKYEVKTEAEALEVTRMALGLASKKLNSNSASAANSVHDQLQKAMR